MGDADADKGTVSERMQTDVNGSDAMGCIEVPTVHVITERVMDMGGTAGTLSRAQHAARRQVK